jgi:hypothetical protein
MSGSEPDSGTLTLQYLRPDGKHSNRNDYRLSGTVRWNKQEELDCFSKGHVDWAYENDLKYQQGFDRAIWDVDFWAFPSAAHPYIDTGIGDSSKITDLTFGLFRPEKLKANVDYHFAYTIILPKQPRVGYHSFILTGQVLNKDCSIASPWCVGLDKGGFGKVFIGEKRAFSVTSTTCWKWAYGKDPVPCSSTAPGGGGGGGAGSGGGGSSGGGGGRSSAGSTVTLAQGPAAPAGYRYAITLSGFPANTSVAINCYDSVSPGGFYPFSLMTDGSGNASTASYCYSGDGPDHWVIAGGVESNHVSWGPGGSAPPPPPPPPATYNETTGGETHTWTNWTNAGGYEGPTIPSNTTVQIACKLTGFAVADGNTWWYRIALSPWNGAYYASADAFYNNGQTSGSLHGTPFVDNNVANC